MWQRELTGLGTPLGPAILRAKRGQLAPIRVTTVAAILSSTVSSAKA